MTPFAAPAPVTEDVTPAPADTYTELSPVIQYVAPAPVVNYAAPASVTEYVAPTPSDTYAALSPVTEYVTPTPTDFHAAPARMIEHVAPSPVNEHTAPPPAVTCFAPCQQSPPETMATVTSDASFDTTAFVNPQFSTAAVESSASQVIGSLPLLDEFAVPVYNRIRQEQLVAEQERVQQHTAAHIVHVPVPQIQEQTVESVQVIPRELFPERIEEQIVDIPVSPVG